MPSLLELRHIAFSYPDGQAALKGVSLSINFNEKVALVGPNGAGKSTLLLHLNGTLSGSGEVRVHGQPISPQTLGRVRATIGLVFQNPDDQLFSPSVWQDVAFGPLHMGFGEREVAERVQTALAAVGMEAYAERAPYHLSTGEKKRVAIATVLSMNPDILVFDEPTAGLDPRARRSLITLLRELDQAMLVSTHDMPMVAELFPRTIIMDDGLIIADDATPAIMADTKQLAAHGLEWP